MEETTTTTPELPEQKPEAIIKNKATLYSTWKQVPAQGPVTYLVVWNVILSNGEVVRYDLLRLFNPEFSDITPEVFSDLVEAGKLREWSMG